MELETFITSAVILLIVASTMVVLFKHFGLGSIAGLLVAGIIVSPYTPGPQITTHVEGIRSFTELGVVFLLFLIGLEMRPVRLWALRRQVFGLGSLQIIFAASIIMGFALLNHMPWKPSLIIGLTMAVSSTALVMQILQDKGEIASPHGSTAFGVLLMQDIAIVPMLALIPILAGSEVFSAHLLGWRRLGIIAGLFLIVWGFGRYVIPLALERVARQKNKEGFLLVVILAVFLAAWAMHQAGLSLAFGAFIMGVILSGCRYSVQIEAYIEPYKGILISLFFVTIGMSIDLRLIAHSPLTFFQYAVVVILIKIIVMFVLCLAFGAKRNVATRVSFLLAQGSEFGFVLLSSAKALKVIDSNTFTTGIGVISVSMLFTPVLTKLGYYMAERFFQKDEDKTHEIFLDKEEGKAKGRVILGGYGRVGHVVAILLNASNVPFIVFDNDPARVARGKEDGFPVYYGDISNPQLLSAIHAEQAALVVLTVDKEQTTLKAISHVKNYYPGIPMLVRARDLEASGRLIQAGATRALPEAVEASLHLATETLSMVGVPIDNVDLLLTGVRNKNYELVDTRE